MVPKGQRTEEAGFSPAAFATTHWSVVLAAGQTDSPQAAQALETLCRTYWYPLYAHVRRRGYSPEDAQDLTQEFFARLLERKAFEQIRREGGKFRSFLLTALNRFLISEWEHARAQKRDRERIAFSLDALDAESRYRFEPTDNQTPEALFERTWVAAALDHVLNRLRDDYAASGKGAVFEHLRPCLTGAEPLLPYADLAPRLGLTVDAVKMAVHRLRQRYGQLLRAEIAHTVARPEDVEEEIQHLLAMVAR